MTSPHSACIRCRATSSTLTGRKVPAPTCSVTWVKSRRPARPARPAGLVEMQRGGGRGDGAGPGRPDGLVVGPVGLVRGAAARRCRAAAASPRPRPAPRRSRRPPGRSAARACPASRPSNRRADAAEKTISSPSRTLRSGLSSAAQVPSARGASSVDLDPRRGRASAPRWRRPRQPRRDHAGVVQHQPVAGPQQLRQVADPPVGDPPRRRPPAAAPTSAAARDGWRSAPRAGRNRSRTASPAGPRQSWPCIAAPSAPGGGRSRGTCPA